MSLRVAALILLAGLSGCAQGASGSFAGAVSGMPPAQVAANLTGLVAHALPPAHSIVRVKLPAGASHKRLTTAFIGALRARGFGVADKGGTPVRYAVTSLDGAVLLRVWTPREVVTRAYQPNKSGKLVPVSPISIGRAG